MEYYFQAFRQYADFGGRARRKEYWMFFLFHVIVLIILQIIAIKTGMAYLYTIYALGALIPGFAVGIRRMHDTGHSGWYIIIPIYNLILACTDSQDGDNEWGPNPKDDTILEITD